VKRLCEQSLYEILEVPPDAATAEIESAYARARDLYAPGSLATYSLMAPEDASALAARIEEAKQVLLDPDARARYDAGLASQTETARAAVRIAATGAGAVAAGPQRPYLVPARTPAPRPPEPTVEAKREEPKPEAEPKVASDPAPVPAPVLVAVEPDAAVEPAARVAPPAAAAAPIQLKKEIPPDVQPREAPLPEGAVWDGEALRKVREGRGLSVRELCDRTKITRYHLENIEADRFTLLPAPVYLRGILLAVARELRLDGPKVARAYLERMASGPGGQR
jgi:hypothetical protein